MSIIAIAKLLLGAFWRLLYHERMADDFADLHELRHNAQQLDNLLNNKRTKLPPAAMEDLQISLREIINLLIKSYADFAHNFPGRVDKPIIFKQSGVESVYEQLYTIQRVAIDFEDAVFRARRDGYGRDAVKIDARRASAELARILNQLQGRRFNTDYLVRAEHEVAPYVVSAAMPLNDGFLAIVTSRDQAFEASAPQAGVGELPADIAVNVYLDTDDESIIDEVMGRVDDLVVAMGYKLEPDIEIQRGSIFRRARAEAHEVGDEIKSRLLKVERAIELAQLDLRQADVDVREADAVDRLLKSLEKVPRACVRAGSILLIKYPYTPTGESLVIMRNLSQLEMHALDKFPEIQKSPESALEALTMALTSTAQASGHANLSPPSPSDDLDGGS